MTSYDEIKSAFESIIKSKYVIDDDLIFQWFLNALAEYELNIDCLYFDMNTRNFVATKAENDSFNVDGTLKRYVILTIAQVMKTYHMQQELRRVNQLNNIIGRDLSLNGTGDTKKYTKEEFDELNYKVLDFFTKLKESAYI